MSDVLRGTQLRPLSSPRATVSNSSSPTHPSSRHVASLHRPTSLQQRYAYTLLLSAPTTTLAPPILRSLCHDVCIRGYVGTWVAMYVCGVYVSTIKRNPWSQWLETCHSSTVLDTVTMPIDFGIKRSRVTGTGSTFRIFGTSCHLANKNKMITIYYENYVDNIKLQNIA